MSVSKEPLSIRNNNPGNLRFVGQAGATQGEGGFARFETPEAGLAAMRSQIELDTQTRGLTLDKFISKYAPSSENNTANYINFVAQKTGLDPRSVVPAERIGDLQRAMIEMEGGPRSASYFSASVPVATNVVSREAPTMAEEPRTTVQASSAQLPMSYRVALAANYLGDTEKESVTDQAMKLIEEMQGEEGGGGSGAVSKKLVSILSPKESGADPFAAMAKAQEENAPRRKPVPRMPKLMAEGGEAKNDDRDLSDEDRQRMRAEQEGRAMGGLRYQMGPLTGQVVKKQQGYEGRVSTPIGDVVPYLDFDPLTGTFRPTEVGVSTGRMGPEGGYEVRYAQPIVPGQKVPPQISGQYRKQLDRNSSVEAGGFYVPIPGMKDAYGGNVRYVQRFADGGDVDYNQMAEQMTVGTVPEGNPGAAAQVAKDVVRGAQYLPYDLLGMPVDIATMAMRPFGYKTEKPFLGSEYLIDKAVQAGIADKPTGSLAETTSRIGMGFVNPASVARQIPKGIAALEKGAETLGTGAVRAITGKPEITPEQIYQAMGDTKGIVQLGAPAISRMPGGTFMENPESRLTQMLTRTARKAQQSAGEDSEKASAAAEMFTKKAADFYKKRAGSVDDELKQELLAGRIKLPEDMDEVFPQYLLEKARKGDISAMRDFERRYDDMIGVDQKLMLSGDRTLPNYEMNREVRQNIEQGMLAQFKSMPELIPDDLLYKLTNKDPTDVRTRIKENPEYFSIVVEPKLKKLLNVDVETITPGDIAAYKSNFASYQPQNLTANELEAIKRDQPIMDLRTSYPDLFGYDIDMLAKQVGKMSTKELKDITFATFVSRASKLAAKEKGLMAQAEELAQAVKKGKPVDPKVTLFGTENFLTLPEGFSWRKIIDPDATILQSALMDNSIKGYASYGSYGPFNNGRKSFEDGDIQLYVLYNKDGLPVTNVELSKGLKSGKFSMRQAQGNGPLSGNVMPNDYLPQLKALANKLNPEDLPFHVSSELRYIDAPEGFAKGGIVDKPLYDRAG